MTVYRRPNLTVEQCDLVEALLAKHLEEMAVSDPKFDLAYRAFIKVRDSKAISTGKRV